MTNNSIQPSARVQAIEEYYFSRKLREVARLKQEGRNILSLAIGGPDLPPAPEVIETLSNYAQRPDMHSYQLTRGTKELRESFSSWYKRMYGVTLDTDSEIQPLIGSKEGILHISMAFLNDGDYVLVPDPGYITYRSATRMVGGIPLRYNLLAENDWQPDFEELENLAMSHNIKLMWVNYPHMPTGTPPGKDLFRRLIDFGHKHDIVIVNDNPYSLILNDNPTSILTVDGSRDIAIEMNSLSKSHNMAGWRMAMVASNPEFINWIVKMKSNVDSGQFRPMMEAACRALVLDTDWTRQLNDVYQERQAIGRKIMSALCCHVADKQCGLFLWGKIPEGYDSSEQFADHLLDRYDLFLTPGSIFGHNGNDYIRLSLCAPKEILLEALHRINKDTKEI